MKHFLTLTFAFVLTACGQSIHTQQVKNGQVVAETEGGIGFRSVRLKTTTNNPLMQTCLADIGSMPSDEQVLLCQEEVRREMLVRGYYPSLYAIQP